MVIYSNCSRTKQEIKFREQLKNNNNDNKHFVTDSLNCNVLFSEMAVAVVPEVLGNASDCSQIREPRANS